MRTKKRINVPNPVAKGFPPSYEPAFKRVVILYAEKKGNQEAHKRYGITEETIRRWRRLRDEIMEQAEHPVRRSQRLGNDSCSESTSSKCDSDYNFLKEGLHDSLSVDIDSMPLKQRLSQNLNESSIASMSSESPLQSLPISPTKLKVTRQGGKGYHKSTEASEVCLKWNSYNSNMQTVFPNLLTKQQYVDATLVSEGQMLKCHKMILSSCSPYFEEILSSISPFQHPVLFMKDVPFWALKAMCDFMYAGEVHISQDKIQDLLAAAAAFKIKGLGTPVDKGEPKQAGIAQIKRETNEVPSLNKVKTEKPDENILPKERLSRKREDRKTFQDVFEESSTAQNTSKIALRKVAVASKPSLNTFQSKPSTSRLNYAERKANSIRRRGRTPKIEASEEPNKVKDVPVLTKTNINDPLDLLQPVYEEVTKDVPLQLGRNSLGKLRGSTRKTRKRKLVDYVEEREESPVFLVRKGTRSRPNVKIPKVFDSHYEERLKEATVATIVREPHTDQNDPLIGVDVEEIKAEPVDVDESAIEVEENMVNYIVQDHILSSQEDEEIIGNFDSPLVNIRRRTTPNMFKKHPPFIVDVHTVSESDIRMLDIQNENVEIVDIAKISNSQVEDEAIINNFDAGQPKTSQIVITNVQSMADNPSESISDKECNSDNTVIGNNLEKSGDDPLITLPDKECYNENTAVDQKNNLEKNGSVNPLITLQCVDSFVSEAGCTDRNEAEEKVLESEVAIKEDKIEVVLEMENISKDTLPLKALEVDVKDPGLTDDIQKLEEIPLQPVEMTGNDQEEIGVTPLKEVPLKLMEMDTKDDELLTDDTPKLEEISLLPVDMSGNDQEVIDATPLKEIPIKLMEMDSKDDELLTDDTPKLEEISLLPVEMSGNDQELIDATPLKEIPIKTMEMDTEDQELNENTPKLEETPMEMDVKGHKLINDTQKLEEIKENGLEDSPDIKTTPRTEELSPCIIEDSQPLLTTEIVEAELEECLASTSTLINPIVPQKIDFFDNEDCAKDVELEDLSCSKPNWSSFKDESDFLGDREVVTDTVDFSGVQQFSAEQCAEDSLLADLDDDLTLKVESGRTNDDPEQTLEMIVQDLNDSLYEMEK